MSGRMSHLAQIRSRIICNGLAIVNRVLLMARFVLWKYIIKKKDKKYFKNCIMDYLMRAF